jgi:hypothetical protein
MPGVASFPGAPGRARDRMCTFAFEGDVSGVDISTMVFDENQLTITPDVTMPGTLDRVRQLLNDEPNFSETIGPFKATDANVRTTKTHALAYFPFEMLEPLLGDDLAARQVFELIVLALIDGGLEDTCSELINVLTVAIVKPNNIRVEPYTLQDQAGKAGYAPGPEAISYHHDGLLYHYLPVLKATPGPPLTNDPALLDVAHSMRDELAEARAEWHDHMNSHDEARDPKSMIEKMGETITDCLLLLCRESYDEDLPPILP